jgi:hypothetical protein
MKNDPYFTRARYPSLCAESGRKINKGDEIAYYPRTKQVFHIDSKQSEELRAFTFAAAFNMSDANY